MKLRDEFEVVGDVRGKGLMIGLELVKNKVKNDYHPSISDYPSYYTYILTSFIFAQESKEPLPAAEVTEIWENCKNHGVLIGKGGLYGTVC